LARHHRSGQDGRRLDENLIRHVQSAAVNQPPSPALLAPPPALRVLLVDDEPEMLAVLAETLQEAGLPVAQAGNAAAALDRLQAQPEIAVLVSDIRMPGTDGLALLRQAMAARQADATALAAVMITGHAGLAAARAAMHDGAAEFLTKPFGAEDLLQAVRHAMAQASGRRAQAALLRRQDQALAAAAAEASRLRGQLAALLPGGGGAPSPGTGARTSPGTGATTSPGTGAAPQLWPGDPARRGAMLAHALLTPLGPILGYADLLQDADLPPQHLHRFAQAIGAGGRALRDNINRLLDYDRLVGGTVRPSLQPVPTAPLLADAMARQAAAAAARQVTLRRAPAAAPSPAMLQGDPQLLARALDEVLANGIAAAPLGSEVTLDLGQDPEGCWIAVTDAGPGLPEALLAAPLAPFSSAEPILNRGKTGLGLGLAMAQRMLALQGGTLTLRRRPEGGSEALLRWPG
jgi:CheY-like chemotaxis protein